MSKIVFVPIPMEIKPVDRWRIAETQNNKREGRQTRSTFKNRIIT